MIFIFHFEKKFTRFIRVHKNKRRKTKNLKGQWKTLFFVWIKQKPNSYFNKNSSEFLKTLILRNEPFAYWILVNFVCYQGKHTQLSYFNWLGFFCLFFVFLIKLMHIYGICEHHHHLYRQIFNQIKHPIFLFAISLFCQVCVWVCILLFLMEASCVFIIYYFKLFFFSLLDKWWWWWWSVVFSCIPLLFTNNKLYFLWFAKKNSR